MNRFDTFRGTVLIVTPAPGWYHQEGLGELFVQLRLACPRELRVLVAPFAVQPDEHNEVQPAALVTRFDDLTPRNLPVAPLLAVELLSPSTRLYDRNTKMAAYERMGVRSYWLVDSEPPGRLTAAGRAAPRLASRTAPDRETRETLTAAADRWNVSE
jgi:Uma2 family endonuclease